MKGKASVIIASIYSLNPKLLPNEIFFFLEMNQPTWTDFQKQAKILLTGLNATLSKNFP